ncbi:polyprenyl diphosphate synthase [Streptomyces longispororuber]|uniref:polyprenyl diphosphate synthase n=1 Tax=Streptomyces longispororuber TaxID=68230 RepID=UPI0036F7B6A1
MTIIESTPVLAPADLGLPQHIGFIADGNRRWSKAHGVDVETGFRHGAAAVHQALEHCRTLGIKAASVFLMSDRNFLRSTEEVTVLCEVIADLIDTAAAAADGPVRILTSGELMWDHGTPRLLEAIRRAEQSTADRPGMTVCLGMGYDGQADVRQAVVRALTAPGRDPRVELDVDSYLSTAGLPAPDLIIRTSGERRLSGFLLYQAADATLHFDDRYWPDYDGRALEEALAVHAAQHRTFGR